MININSEVFLFSDRNAQNQENLQATFLHMNTWAKKGDAGAGSNPEHKGFCSTNLRALKKFYFFLFFFSSFNSAGLPAGYEPEGLSSQTLLWYIYNGSASKVCLFQD